MVTGLDPEKAPERVAIYRRTLPVSIARVWENVYDWEHLPWLHSESFTVIELEESGLDSHRQHRQQRRSPLGGVGPCLA